ncbi:MAG: cytochrome c oxidase subunit 3, partial [Bacteroidota bacterium]
YYAAKKDQIGNIKIFTIITFLLGLVFLYLQVEGFWEMHADGVYVFGTGSNPASSFVFVIAFMHGLHIIGGLVFLLIVLVKAFLYQIHAKSTVTIRMCTTFWHYLDILWLYLFAFMLLYP